MPTPAARQHPSGSAPLFRKFSDLFAAGFSIDWGVGTFLVTSNLLFFILTPIAYLYAPPGLWTVMLTWTLVHAFVGALSTTVYAHRLVSHGAANEIRTSTHVVFLLLHLFAVQASVRRWSAQHVIHHAVDKTGQSHLDPYSATWFDTTWRNFAWSHMVTFLFNHPESKEFAAAFKAKAHPAIVWQDKYYVPLMILANFILPMSVGAVVAGWIGALCMLVASIGGYVLAQHNTWTVNSVTHMWGFKSGLLSSAKNNYLWLGPLGEGNHHADHHDFPRDFRNGFGWSGWLLDPTRYVLLCLEALGLVQGLNRAGRLQEAKIITRRNVRDSKAKSQLPVWQAWESQLTQLGDEWQAAARTWDQFKLEKVKLQQQLRKASAEKVAVARERMGATHEELIADITSRLTALSNEMADARERLRARREEFFQGLRELKQANLAAA